MTDTTSPRTIAIIPARGGSKGIPKKNLALIDGVPLVAYTIRAALGVDQIEDVLVSTDDEEIAAVALKEGASVIRRPEELARDDSPTEPCVLHAMEKWEETEGVLLDWVVLLQPTAPLRDSTDIANAFKILEKSGADCILSVMERREFHWEREGDFGVAQWDIDHPPRRQELRPDLIENGAIYISRADLYRKRGNRLGGKIALYEMPLERSIDVDEPFDLWLVESTLRYKKQSGEG
ncbi:MAG: acylneuraminate cytidylyltransferase family protein [Candidatus Omnitrophica bacterium]|nr:acylneuraminate cytidylyltransferase family protein [Candidatus Omnitrophota bacterium]